MVLPPLASTRRTTASAIVAPLGGAASGSEPASVGERLRTAVYAPPTYVPPGDDFTLAQVIVVHRHGDRAPISRSAGSKLQCDASACLDAHIVVHPKCSLCTPRSGPRCFAARVQ